MDESAWRLPGPDRLIGRVRAEVQRGRHVMVVLPRARAEQELFVDGLMTGLMRDLRAAGEDPRRPLPYEPGTRPLDWLAECLVLGDDPPVNAGELLDHPDAAGVTAVLDCTGPCGPEPQAFGDLVRRLTLESPPRPVAKRPRVVAVTTRQLLPSHDADDVALVGVWWWGRVTRWDVAARIGPMLEAACPPNVLREVHLETILEVCRWDLDLAEHVAGAWDGDPDRLAAVIKEGNATGVAVRDPVPVLPTASGPRPPVDLLELWDAGGVELWHGQHSGSPYEAAVRPGAVEHAVWAAHARVLLPWIEDQRRTLGALLKQRYGLVTEGSTGPVEVGPLFTMVRERVPRTDGLVREASAQLMRARNNLAHLRGLSHAEQVRLVEACEPLCIA